MVNEDTDATFCVALDGSIERVVLFSLQSLSPMNTTNVALPGKLAICSIVKYLELKLIASTSCMFGALHLASTYHLKYNLISMSKMSFLLQKDEV